MLSEFAGGRLILAEVHELARALDAVPPARGSLSLTEVKCCQL